MTASHPDRVWLPAAPPALVDTRHEYEHLFSIYVPIAAAVFALVVLAIVLSAVRYRNRPGRAPARWHEHNRLEASYATLLALVVAFLLYLSFSAEHQVDTVAARERPSVTIDVVGAKWEWQFAYPAYGFSVRSGTVGDQPLVLPAGRVVRFNLSSLDVIHSFWVPEARFKRDLIPGATETVALSFSHAGRFSGQCAEFCGLRHADMLFTVHAVSPAAFTAWAERRGTGPVP